MADERILRVGVLTEEAEQKLDNLGKKFTSTGASAQAMENATKRTSQATKQLGNEQVVAAAKTTKLRSTFSELAAGLRQSITLLAGLGGSVSFAVAIRSALQLDASLDKVKAITGAATAEMKFFNTELRRLSETVGRPQTELAESLFLIKQAGFDGADAMRILDASSKAAAIGLGETKVIADAVSSVLNLYGRSTISAEKATGILVLTAREGKVTMDQFEAGLGKVLPVAKSLGITFDQVSAALAAMSRSGVDTKQAAAALASIMDTLAAPTTDAVKALQEAGVSIDKMRESLANQGIIAVLGELKEAFEGNDEGLNRLFPNLRGMTGLLTLVGDKAEEATRIQRLLAEETGGSLAKAFVDVTDESLEYDKAMQKINNQMIELGSENLPVVVGALNLVNSAMDRMRSIAANLGSGLARVFGGPADEVESLRKYIKDATDELEALQRKRAQIVRVSFSNPQLFDSTAKKYGFESFEQLNMRINEGKRILRNAVAEEGRLVESELNSLADRLGEKTVKAYRDSIAKSVAGANIAFGLGNLFSGLSAEELERMRRDLELIDRFEQELERKRQERNRQREAAAANNKPAATPDKPAAPTAIDTGAKITTEELDKIRALADQYDEFSGKVRDLTKSYQQLSAGVKAGAISSAQAAKAYDGMLVDIAKSASAAGTFEEAMLQSKQAVALLDEALRTHRTSLDTVKTAYGELFGGLVQLAGEADTFKGKLNNSSTVVNQLARAISANGMSVEAAKGNVRSLVEQLADASVASGVFAESVRNANSVLNFMAGLVKAGALDIEVARRIYKDLGETLNGMQPNLEKNQQLQEAWNNLIQAGSSPLDIYRQKLADLSTAYRTIVENGGDAEKAQRLFAKGAADAAKEYDDALNKLTPKQEQQKEALDRVAQASSNAFSQMIQGATSAKDALNGLLRSILDVILQLLVLEPLKQAVLTGLGSIFPGAGAAPAGKASGGIVRPGRAYEVGEEGPELLIGNSKSARAILVGQRGPEQIIAPPGGGRIISNLETKQILQQLDEEQRRQLMLSSEQQRTSLLANVEKRAAGGNVTANSAYLVGEEGPEMLMLNKPISSQQSKSFRPIVVKVDVNKEQPEAKTIVNIQNYTPKEVEQTTRTDQNGNEVIDIVIGAVARNIDERGSVSKAISRANRLIRR